jgi:hypothetical protein
MSSSMECARSAQRHRSASHGQPRRTNPRRLRPPDCAFARGRFVALVHGWCTKRHGQRANCPSLVRRMPVLSYVGRARLYGLWRSLGGARTPVGAGPAGGYDSGRRGERCAWTMSSALRLIYRDSGEYVRSAASVARRRARPVGAQPALRAARFPRTRSGLRTGSVCRHRPGRQGRDSAGHRNDLRGA